MEKEFLMGFRVKKSFKIAPGVRLNVGKTRSSLSIGGKGLTTNISKRGVKTTASIPGTGLSYSTNPSGGKRASAKKNAPKAALAPAAKESPIWRGIVGFAVIGIVGYAILKLIF
ncbi:DUF4236 domain-containing protein [Celeribacter ethanolicus]|uniref:DUF4236 domain-containing protein n=1 Tax=Celeribacter ethanolicus TaxID=1758178 RepID=UPI003082A354